MPSGTFHYYLVTKLNADATTETRHLHCYVVKFRFTSLYDNQQIDLDLCLTGSRVPGYNTTSNFQNVDLTTIVAKQRLTNLIRKVYHLS